PLFTALISWGLLDERLAGIQIIGMLVMIGGVIFVQRGLNPAKLKNSPSEEVN
ncbi:MAG: hypothetical protein HQ574_08010, partial [Chloroflexi bacterium]|nr:hypothetical protein [Chloroflexota bacterium]